MATKADILNILAAIRVAFPNSNLNYKAAEQEREIYYNGLGDLPSDLLMAGANAAIYESGRAFAPTPGEIRSAALRLAALAAGIPSTWEAYSEAARMPARKRRIVRVDDTVNPVAIYYEDLEWSHPFVERVALTLGWPDKFPGDEPGVDRAHFQRCYEGELEHLLDNDARLPVVQNYLDNHRGSKPRLIKDVVQAAKLLPGGTQ